MKIIKNPNLPQSKVKNILISCDALDAVETFKKYNISSILTTSCELFDKPIQNHADMMFIHLGEENCIVQEKSEVLVKNLTNIGFDVITSKNTYTKKYPNDVGLNCVFIGNYLIGRVESMDKALIEFCENNNKQIINVKQGYSKCSICVVNENSIITEDESIYNSLKNKFDVLKIQSGCVSLNGYDYGFFGGCSGLIDKNLLAVNGDIKLHTSYKLIVNFLKERGVDLISLKSGQLEDIGSIIPLTEE